MMQNFANNRLGSVWNGFDCFAVRFGSLSEEKRRNFLWKMPHLVRRSRACVCVCLFVRNDRKSIHSNNCKFRFSLAFFWHRRSIITGKADSLLGHCVSCAIRKQIFREIIIDLDNEWLIVYVRRSPSQFDRRIRHCLFWKWLFNK